MKLKQKPQRKSGPKKANKLARNNLANRLADIELKLDHIIERIRDSLHQLDIRDLEEDEA